MTDPGTTADPDFEGLLDHLHLTRGFDFTGYKQSSLVRRVTKRMQRVGIEGFGPYLDYLEVHPEEFRSLFDTILINVTGFFRDPEAWEAISGEIIPRLVAAKRPEEPIRAWSAGCASGEEAYSLAIALAEALGQPAFRDRVKIYATDVDHEALAKARSAQYDEKELQGVPPDLLEKYFEPAVGTRRAFQKDLRRCVIFGRHDLIQDAPISRIDLLSCRNTMMYFNTETQARILDRFHYALADRGTLFLGKAETLMTYNEMFVPVDLKRRIFAKVPRANHLRDRLMGTSRAGGEESAWPPAAHPKLREAAFEAAAVAQLVVEFSGLLALANDRARAIFGIAPGDLGRPFQDLQVSYRPADLRSCLDRVYNERKAVTLAEVEWSSRPGEVGYLDIHVVPLTDPGGSLLGAGITFVDATVNRRLQEELQTSHKELEVAYEELQSTVEELETTNEELQSTNEELETTNEELQSTNEEIETVNAELRLRGEERDRVNAFLQSILASLGSGVVVVDRGMLVQVWNAKCEDLWGLRLDEVRGKNLLTLDIGLPLDQVRQSLRACLAGESLVGELDLDATNRRGKAIRCRVRCSPMVEGGGEIGGAVLLMEEDEKGTTAA